MKIFEQGKDIVAKRYGFKSWDALFDYEFENRTGKLKEYVSEATAEAREILYKEYKERFPDSSDEQFEFFDPYLFVNLINRK